MDSMGVDVARGGRDETIVARRHGSWFDELIAHPGSATPDGPAVAGQVILARRDKAPVHIDVIGCGGSPFDFLIQNGVHAIGVNVAEASRERSRDGELKFRNLRAELWWRMREALDPLTPEPVALPRDARLRADLCAPRWKHTAAGILIEGKEELIRRLGRSPDRGDAVCLARMASLRRDGAAAQMFDRINMGGGAWL
jgi:hypothetical protein